MLGLLGCIQSAAFSSRERFDEQHAILAGAIVVGGEWHAVALMIAFFDLEAHAAMEGDRAAIDRCGDAAHTVAAARAHGFEEQLVQPLAQAALALIGVDADEVNIGLTRMRLRHKADQECDDLIVFFDREAGILKMREEQPGQQPGHLPTAPPLVDDCDNRRVIALADWAYVHWRCLLNQELRGAPNITARI